jgi:hypothetical protein
MNNENIYKGHRSQLEGAPLVKAGERFVYQSKYEEGRERWEGAQTMYTHVSKMIK